MNAVLPNRYGMAKGFTLVELLVVVSIIGVLSVLSIAGFVDYSHNATVAAAALEFSNVLTVARSRAQSQVVPLHGICVVGALDGYAVTICPSGATDANTKYQLRVVCGNRPGLVSERLLPQGVLFSCGSEQSFTFRVLSGVVVGAAAEGTPISVAGFGKTKTVTIHQDGRIVAN